MQVILTQYTRYMDLLHLIENTFYRKRISANPSPNANPSPSPNLQDLTLNHNIFGLTK